MGVEIVRKPVFGPVDVAWLAPCLAFIGCDSISRAELGLQRIEIQGSLFVADMLCGKIVPHEPILRGFARS